MGWNMRIAAVAIIFLGSALIMQWLPRLALWA
jgi:hypothetical protein